MTTHLEPNPAILVDSATTLPRFPVGRVSGSLLAIVQSALDGVIIIDATRQIVLINHRAERMFGYPARQLLDKSVDMLLPPHIGQEQRRRMERLVAIRMSGKRTKLGLRGVHASGEEFPVSACISRITVHGEMFLVVILRDLKSQIGADRKQRPVKANDLRRLAVSSQQANEVEKRRFSRKLYDDIGQRLSVLKLDLDWLENSLSEKDDCVPARVAQMQGILDKVITLTKNMASTLRPPLLDDFGLMPAVEWMTENFQKRTAIACTVQCLGSWIKLDDPVESAVFRVIQEGLLNVEKHAHASSVKVLIEFSDKQIDVMIQDNGIGMQEGSENKPGCYGLIAMQERIFILGGTISVQNTKPHGVAIHAAIPIDPLPAQE